ncbi:MAG: sulfite exporter TauE/SafE family protein [Bacillota bacterium]
MTLPLLALIGFGVGVLGTLVGAGGGFIVVPVLMLIFGLPPTLAAGTSLVVVAANALAGTASYARQGKVDWWSGLFLTFTAYPGTLLGAWLGPQLDASRFHLLFGLLLLGLAGWMVVRTLRVRQEEAAALEKTEPTGRMRISRQITLRDGTVHRFSFNGPFAAVTSFGVGLIGAMLGIGGGPLIVPLMINGLNYPVHVATATSQSMIFLTSIGAVLLYLAGGNLVPSYAGALSLGVLAGAPAGAWLSARTRPRAIVWIMSVVLAFLGLRLIL